MRLPTLIRVATTLRCLTLFDETSVLPQLAVGRRNRGNRADHSTYDRADQATRQIQ